MTLDERRMTMSEAVKEIVEEGTIQESDTNIDENAIKSLIYMMKFCQELELLQ